MTTHLPTVEPQGSVISARGTGRKGYERTAKLHRTMTQVDMGHDAAVATACGLSVVPAQVYGPASWPHLPARCTACVRLSA